MREYSFAGSIKCVLDASNDAVSVCTRRYLVYGQMHYYGRRADGTRVNVPLMEEPDDDEHVYAVATDGSEALDMDGEAEEDEQEEEEKVYTGKRSYAVVIEDRNRLPLPHVGMFVSLVLQREQLLELALLVDASGRQMTALPEPTQQRYLHFLYGVQRVRSWRACKNVSKGVLVGALTQVPTTFAALQKRNAADAKLVSQQWRADSVAVKRTKKAQMGKVGDLPVKQWSTVIQELTRSPVTRQLTLSQLMATCSVHNSLQPLLQPALSPLYALSHDVLADTDKRRLAKGALPLQKAVQQLRIGGRQLNCTSAVEVRALDYWLANTEPQKALFFGALDVLTPTSAVHSPLMNEWAGLQYVRVRDRALRRNLLAFVRRHLADHFADEEDEDELEQRQLIVIDLAYQLHRQQQQPWHRCNDIVDMPALVRAVNRFYRADSSPVTSDQLSGAVLFLQSVGAWCTVPEMTAARLSLQAGNEHAAGYEQFCTERAYQETLKLADLLHQVAEQASIVPVRFTGQLPRCVQQQQWLLLYAGSPPPTEQRAKSSVALAVSRLLASTLSVDNDVGCVAPLMAYRRVAVLDAHLLTRSQLLMLLQLLAEALLPGTQLLLVGDCGMARSEFAVLARWRGLVKLAHEPLQVEANADALPVGQCRGIDLVSVSSQAVAGWPGGLAALVEQMAECTVPLANNEQAARDLWRSPARIIVGSRWRSAQARLLQPLTDEQADWSTTLLNHKPYVGVSGVTRKVKQAYLCRELPARVANFNRTGCLTLFSTNDAQRRRVSLDNDRLLLELANSDGIDHRICCGSWAANVLHVARHRSTICSQSVVTIDELLPVDASCRQLLNALLLGNCEGVRLDGIHRTASLLAQHGQIVATYADQLQPLVRQLARREPLHRRSMLLDILCQ